MRVSKGFVSLAVATLMCTSPVLGQDAMALSKAEIEKIVREYILQHPEVLMESVRAYQERERAAAQQRSKSTINAKKADLFKDAASPVAGKTDATVEIVQFFDYRCGYCKRMPPVLAKLLDQHKNVRLVYKELPILGPDSHVAARAALAAHKQGAYLAFHQELMKLNAPLTQSAIDEIAAKLSLDVAKLKTDMNSAEVQAALTANQQLASAIGVQSTPSFVIGDELVAGAMDLTGFEALISKAR
jgi:protein-disulfide isomerase